MRRILAQWAVNACTSGVHPAGTWQQKNGGEETFPSMLGLRRSGRYQPQVLSAKSMETRSQTFSETRP
jgi:hypothetical protein